MNSRAMRKSQTRKASGTRGEKAVKPSFLMALQNAKDNKRNIGQDLAL
jgi:hypothetical protein